MERLSDGVRMDGEGFQYLQTAVMKESYSSMNTGAGEERTMTGEEEIPSAMPATWGFLDNSD